MYKFFITLIFNIKEYKSTNKPVRIITFKKFKFK